MSRMDPECFPQSYARDERVCANCVADRDLRRFIRSQNGPRGCSYCRRRDAPTAPIDVLADFIQERMGTFYGLAVEQLPYETREGGYQGWHVDTQELLFDHIGLELTRDDDGRLAGAVLSCIADEEWCEFDWLSLDLDDRLQHYWEQFCATLKHRRRFFFHQIGESETTHPDEQSLFSFLYKLASLVDTLGLVKEYPAGYQIYRARGRSSDGASYTQPGELGPPPAEYALQSNRMNPPGIPMFYGAERETLACVETRQHRLSVGRFETLRTTNILDLAALPRIPGLFSERTREEVLALKFLTRFANLVVEPVPRDERTHIDYIPTQVFTEFLRDFDFDCGRLDGVRYKSSMAQNGANVLLFATQEDVVGCGAGPYSDAPMPWLRLCNVRQRMIS